MSAGLVRLAARVRQPEYTGSNRCIPCTIVNIVLAFVFAVVVGVGIGEIVGTDAGAVAVGAILVTSLLAIYLRGYLVPGTPALTERYFPDWLLAWFDKGTTIELGRENSSENGADPERILVEGGITVPCVDEDDLCLADGLRERWRGHVVDVRKGDRLEQIAAFVERDPDDIELDDPEDGEHIAVTVEEGGAVAHWESEAALIADLAGSRLLAERLESWTDRPLHERGQIVSGLRAFLETCPACDGRISIDEETVESCCRSYEVYAVTCNECEARLLEVSA